MPYANPDDSRDNARWHQHQGTRKKQDIGELPPCENIARRDACRLSIKAMAETYFKESIFLSWSDDQLTAISIMEGAILNGGKFALAMPRGSGKTTLCFIAVIWAILFHHKVYGVMVGATEKAAKRLIDRVKNALAGNDLLHADFPKETLPFMLLGREARAANGQRYQGQQTGIKWEEMRVVFARIPGSKCPESVIEAVSIMSQDIRGTAVLLLDGRTSVRPDLAMIDDPQTKESAVSTDQCEKRRSIIDSDILMMCGPKAALSALMPCTVICKDDLADQMLDRKKAAEWCGRKFKAMYAFPENMKLWDTYYSMRCQELEETESYAQATEFYRERMDEMNFGASVAWKERFLENKGEISGIQHCMHVYLEDPQKFAAEYQQEPMRDQSNQSRQIEEGDLKQKRIRIEFGKTPVSMTKLTAFVDVQKHALFWTVMGFNVEFSSHLVAYGAFPDQKRSFYMNNDLQYKLERHYLDQVPPRPMGMEAWLYAAIEDVQELLLGQEWKKEDGTIMRVERLLIDSKWGESTDVVFEACRRTKYPTIVAPSQGRGLGAKATPMEFFTPKPNEELGFHWIKTVGRSMRTIPYIQIDTNFWKSFVANRIFTSVGDPGSLTIPGGLDGRHDNRLLYGHLTSEFRKPMAELGVRVVDEWEHKPQKFDNHWWDGIVGCHAAASMLGCVLKSSGGKQTQQRKVTAMPPRRAG